MQAIDILNYERELKKAGVPDAQASIHAQKLAELLDNNTVTKADIQKLEDQFFFRIDRLETRVDVKFEAIQAKIEAIEDKFTAKFEALESRLNWLVGLISLTATLIPISNFLMHYFKFA